MKAEANQIATELLALPASLRAFLAHKLISSLEEDADENAEAEWMEVIDRRSKEIEDGKVICRPVTEVVAEIRSKLHASRQQSSGG